ncbi:MAG: hypothetical protein ACW98Y_13940 [Candidatus Thorarchaeota archaeon]|jgi:hypothetical protein
MKRNNTIITIIICSMVLGGIFPVLGEPIETTSYILETTTMPPIQLAQETEEFNISSYLDFSDATLEIMLKELFNSTDGTVFKSGDHQWEVFQISPSLTDYYWAIAALGRMYEASVINGAPNATISLLITKITNNMVHLFLDPDYPGYGINTFSDFEVRTTKRAGVQSYAYQALRIAEAVNSSLDYGVEKQSAVSCIAEMLYDNTYGGLHFFTMRNGSLTVPSYIYEVYPNDGKRLDHIALGAMTLYEAGIEQNNSTLIAMANSSMSYMLTHMKQSFQGDYFGFKLAVNRTGYDITDVGTFDRPGTVVISDLNAIAIRALITAYNTTGNSTFLTEADELVDALMLYNWDTEFGGWYAETLLGLPFDPLDDEDVKYYKYSEIQFQMIISFEQLYELTNNLFYIRTTIDVLELLLRHLWDIEDGGFIQNGNGEWTSFTPDWQWHHTAVQGLGILALERIWSYGLPIISNVRINPVSPRPNDSVLVSATALDNDGIDTVYVTYTSDIGENRTEGEIDLLPNPEVGGVFNNTFGYLNDSASVNFYVIANDTLGNEFVVGIYHFLVRADIYEPIIALRQIYPDQINAGDICRIEIGTYEFPLHSATLYCTIWWKLNDGFYNPVNMTLTGADENDLVWQVDLGPFAGGDRISFYCIAEDETGNSGTSPFYRLTIISETQYVSPIDMWQFIALVGLISAPGAGVAYVWTRKRHAREQQRILKKEARKRGRRRRGRSRSRSRSQSDTDGGS